jgi:hypothetical protein
MTGKQWLGTIAEEKAARTARSPGTRLLKPFIALDNRDVKPKNITTM